MHAASAPVEITPRDSREAREKGPGERDTSTVGRELRVVHLGLRLAAAVLGREEEGGRRGRAREEGLLTMGVEKNPGQVVFGGQGEQPPAAAVAVGAAARR
jgi:hypothetical protein